MLSEGRVGQRIGSDAADLEYRLTRYLSIAVSEAHGLYYDAIDRGNCFVAAMQAAAALGTGLTATAVTLTLFNPSGSARNLLLMETNLVIPVATTAGQVVYAANVAAGQAAPITTTAATIRNAKLGAGNASVAAAYTAATLPAAPVVVRNLAGIISTTPGGIHMIVDRPGLIITPGNMVTIQGITTNATGAIGFLWEELLP